MLGSIKTNQIMYNLFLLTGKEITLFNLGYNSY